VTAVTADLTAVTVKTLQCNSIVNWAYGSAAYRERHRVLAHSVPLITGLHWFTHTHTLLRDSRPSGKAV